MQQELRTTPGSRSSSSIRCATEQRRRIKRGMAPMHHAGLHSSGTLRKLRGLHRRIQLCGVIRPLATAKGRKRQIDQTVCNQDLSCLQATCPSLVTIEGATLRKRWVLQACPHQHRTGDCRPAAAAGVALECALIS